MHFLLPAAQGSPFIVGLHDFFLEDIAGIKCAYIELEFCSSGDLARRISEGGAMRERVMLNCMMQLCKALKFVHSKKVIHCDIKPANILVFERCV